MSRWELFCREWALIGFQMRCCPICCSPDTVSYWAKVDDSLIVHVYKRYYPNARRCIDCEHVWWKGPQPKLDLKNLKRVTSAEPTVWPSLASVSR